MSKADLEEFRLAMLDEHNRLRALHGVPELCHNDGLHDTAQLWAETLADRGFLQYSELPGIGESVVFLDINGHRPCGREVTKQWYKERARYRYDDSRWRKDAVHFTQMVWKTTTDMGVGVAKVKKQDKYVIVTHYHPPGNTNMPGDFKKNVLPPLDSLASA